MVMDGVNNETMKKGVVILHDNTLGRVAAHNKKVVVVANKEIMKSKIVSM